MQNRLESAVRSIQISDESLSSARSRIADTDVAQETADLTRNNILTMSGSAVLAQANQSGMLAIKLLS